MADEVSREALDAGERVGKEYWHYEEDIRDTVRRILEAAAPILVAAAVEAERQRILEGAEKLKTILSRPGHGFGPAYFEEVGMVPWDELADLIEGGKP